MFDKVLPEVNETYQCRKCGQRKLRTDFPKRGDDIRKVCRECHNARNRGYRAANPEMHAQIQQRARWKQFYGLTPEEYAEMYHRQNGRCAICGTDDPGKGKRSLVVDHCHETGENRGLLCDQCNRGLGHFKDSVDLLNAAADYIERFRGGNT